MTLTNREKTIICLVSTTGFSTLARFAGSPLTDLEYSNYWQNCLTLLNTKRDFDFNGTIDDVRKTMLQLKDASRWALKNNIDLYNKLYKGEK